MELPCLPVHSAASVRAAEARALADLGLDSHALMQRAGEQGLAALHDRWPRARRMVVLCGPGNNGGDGYVLARLARREGREVSLVAPTGSPAAGAAARAADEWQSAGGQVAAFSPETLSGADILVDAMFGTGLDRRLESPWPGVIAAVNAGGRRVCALDLPSGLDADTGATHGACIRADLSVSFLALKPGLYLGAGPEHVGTIVRADLGLPEQLLADRVPVLRLLGDADLSAALPRRARGAHKGLHGRLLLIGGGPAMPGAARLAGDAALRAGAGLVTVAAHASSAGGIAAGSPELICHALEGPRELAPLLAAADVVAIGPGLGQSEWARTLFAAALAAQRPLVLDADALNLLAQSPARLPTACLTPHPGEAARLLGGKGRYATAADVQADRLGALAALRERYGGIVILKGAGSLIASSTAPPRVCDRGNPGMAVAGMGDVLTGIVAGIAAERIGRGDEPQLALERASLAGVLVHALAGDRAAQRGERGLIASDVLGELRACVNPAS